MLRVFLHSIVWCQKLYFCTMLTDNGLKIYKTTNKSKYLKKTSLKIKNLFIEMYSWSNHLLIIGRHSLEFIASEHFSLALLKENNQSWECTSVAKAFALQHSCWDWSPALDKSGLVAHAYNSSIWRWDRRIRGSRLSSAYSKCEASLGYMRPCQKKKKEMQLGSHDPGKD